MSNILKTVLIQVSLSILMIKILYGSKTIKKIQNKKTTNDNGRIERFDAQYVAEHANYVRRFAVRDRLIDCFVDFRRLARRHHNRPRLSPPVLVEYVEHVVDLLHIHRPIGSNVVKRHEVVVAREALVEPQVVPPAGRDQIAEPLVHGLVRDYASDDLLLGQLGLVRRVVDEIVDIDDEAKVFHAAELEVGHSDVNLKKMQNKRREIAM